MKIAFITQDFPPDIGGIQTYSLEIAKRLHLLCSHFVLIAPHKPNAQTIDQTLDFEVIRIKTSNTLIGFAAIPTLIKVLREHKIDILLHAQWQSLAVAAVAKKMGLVKLVVCAAHGREFFFNPFEKNRLLAKIYQAHKKYLVAKVDLFLPVSHYTSTVLSQQLQIPQNKRTVVINGTNPALFFPKDTQALQKQYGFENKLIISSITRLIERKAVDTVLHAIPFIVQKVPNLLYLVVGEGSFKPHLLAIVAALNIEQYVKFVGKVPYAQVSDYYNLSDIYVMPSKLMLPEVEAFGIVYLEANACGKPAIGSKTGGIADAIIDGETGLLVEEQNPQALAQAVISLLLNDELRQKMGKKGRERVEKEANWEAVSLKIFELIKAHCEKQ